MVNGGMLRRHGGMFADRTDSIRYIPKSPEFPALSSL